MSSVTSQRKRKALIDTLEPKPKYTKKSSGDCVAVAATTTTIKRDEQLARTGELKRYVALMHFMLSIIVPNLERKCSLGVISACYSLFSIFSVPIRNLFCRVALHDVYANVHRTVSLMAHVQQTALRCCNMRLALSLNPRRILTCVIPFPIEKTLVSELECDSEVLDWFKKGWSKYQDYSCSLLLSRVAVRNLIRSDIKKALRVAGCVLLNKPRVFMTAFFEEFEKCDAKLDLNWVSLIEEKIIWESSMSYDMKNESYMKLLVYIANFSSVFDNGCATWAISNIIRNGMKPNWDTCVSLLKRCISICSATLSSEWLGYMGTLDNMTDKIHIDYEVTEAVIRTRSEAMNRWLFGCRPAGYDLGGNRKRNNFTWKLFVSCCMECSFNALISDQLELASALLAICDRNNEIRDGKLSKRYVSIIKQMILSCNHRGLQWLIDALGIQVTLQNEIVVLKKVNSAILDQEMSQKFIQLFHTNVIE